jgi:hypothetical protein
MFVKKFYTVLNQNPDKLHVTIPTALSALSDRVRNFTQSNRR